MVCPPALDLYVEGRYVEQLYRNADLRKDEERGIIASLYRYAPYSNL
jgi:hypothetical protein